MCSVASAGLSWAWAVEDAVDLDALEAAALAEGAAAEAWWAYAQGLAAAERDDHALQAIDRVLALAPYHEEARFQRTLLLARVGDPEPLLAWLEDLVFTHPAMAANCFARTELAPYLSDQRFRDLAEEARIQAVD